MNKVLLIGRLTGQPELRYTPNGTAVCQFTLAVDRAYKKEGEQNTDFINIVVWNKPAENAAQYLDKGRQCAIEGRLQIRSYDKDGQKRYITEVVAERVEFLGNKQDNVGKNRLEDDGFVDVDFSADEIPF